MVKKFRNKSYGLDNPIGIVFPEPIISQRAPLTSDLGFSLGQIWIHEPSNKYYALTSISSNLANWEVLGGQGGAPITEYVVDASGSGDYTTIQDAIDASQTAGLSAAMIFVKPGTYTENLTLYDGLILRGDNIQSIITGVHTPPASGSVIFMDLYTTSATDVITSAAAGTARLRFFNCTFNCTNGYAIDCANWTGPIDMLSCGTASTADGILRVGASTAILRNSHLGAGATALSITGGTLLIDNCRINNPISPAGANAGSIVGGSYIGGTITLAGTSALAIANSYISTGAAAALTQSSAGVITLTDTTITSSANPCITGAGAGVVNIGDVTFTSNNELAATLTLGYVSATRLNKVLVGDNQYNVSVFSTDSALIQAFGSDETASGLTDRSSVLGNTVVTAGDGNHISTGTKGVISAASGSNVLQVTGTVGYCLQSDGSTIASTASGTEGWLNLEETDNADLPAVYAFAVKGYLDSTDAAGVPAGIVAGIGSVVEYNTPFDAKAYGVAVTRLDAGGGAGTAGQAAFGVVQGTVAAADWLYGIDFYTATNGFTNAEIRFQNQSTIEVDTEGVTFSGDVATRAITQTNTKIEAFNVCPILQSRATTGVAPTGSTGDRNIMYCQDGVTMEQFIIGAGQTIIAPRLDDTGLLIGLDVATSEGAEYNFGIQTTSKHVYTIGTSADFFFEAEFTVATVAGAEPLAIGFRKVEANNGTWTAYADYATIGIVTSENAGTITISDEQTGGGTTYTNTTDAWTDGQKHTLRVNVTTAGVVTYLIDGVAPSATAAYTFTNALAVMPFIHWVQAAGTTSALHIHSLKCGFQDWN